MPLTILVYKWIPTMITLCMYHMYYMFSNSWVINKASSQVHVPSLSRFVFAAASLWSARSVAFLCPKSNVGTQSILHLSQLLAALPETKCFSHTRSFSKFSSVRWSRLIAEIQRDLLSSESCCASSP